MPEPTESDSEVEYDENGEPKDENVLTRKIGPLATWQWAAVVVGAWLLYRFISGRGTSTTTAQIPVSDPFSGGGGAPLPGGTSSTPKSGGQAQADVGGLPGGGTSSSTSGTSVHITAPAPTAAGTKTYTTIVGSTKNTVTNITDITKKVSGGVTAPSLSSPVARNDARKTGTSGVSTSPLIASDIRHSGGDISNIPMGRAVGGTWGTPVTKPNPNAGLKSGGGPRKSTGQTTVTSKPAGVPATIRKSSGNIAQ